MAVLAEFVVQHRETIIERARARVAWRQAPRPTQHELTNGVPVFLDQLVAALHRARQTDVTAHQELQASASKHGSDLMKLGLNIGQVVHDYGDVCQSVTELAIELNAPLQGEEFKTLNLCLDDAIAEAVTEFSHQREAAIAKEGNERVGILAHELRNLLNTAMLAFASIKSGRVSAAGSTAKVLDRSLDGLRELVDRSLVAVRLDAGIQRSASFLVAEFIEEVEIGASLSARDKGLQLRVDPVDRAATMEGDRQILAGVVTNLLQNAFKFTRPHSSVALTTTVTDDRVLFEVQDECGGLPAGAQNLFKAFEQHGTDRTGVGLGLTISLKAARAHGGEVRVRDLPGQGCVFALDLPRRMTAP